MTKAQKSKFPNPLAPQSLAPQQLDLLNRPSGRSAIITASGFVLDLLEPDATGLPIEDVARALSAQPRWAGATRPFYSVAEHSVMVSHLVPEALAFDGLMHDAEEFVTGDWPSPLKVLIGRELLKEKLAPIKKALAKAFGYRLGLEEVKRADLVCMATELRDILPGNWMDWGHLPPPHTDRINPVGPERAYQLFLERFNQVTPKALGKIL